MKPAWRQRLPLVVVLLLGTALRLFRLGAGSLWYDETVSVFLAGSPVPELLRHTAGDIHPPGYYLLLRGWLILAGYPTGHADANGQGLEFASAFFSLFFGVLLIALVYTLARRLAGHRVALFAAGLVAVSPYNVWYGQEVRMYTLGAALGVVAMLALWEATRPERSGAAPRWWLGYALAAAAGLYTLYYFAFLLLPINMWALARVAVRRSNGQGAAGRGRTQGSPLRLVWFNQPPAGGGRTQGSPLRLASFDGKRAWLLLANVVAVVLYVPWVGVAWRQVTQPPVPPWRSVTAVGAALYESWTALVAGQSAPGWLWLAGLLLIPLYCAGLWALAGTAGKSDRRALSRAVTSPAALLCLATFGSLALILLASAATPLYHVRYVFTYSPAYYIVLAAGLAWLGQGVRPAALVLTLAWLAAAGITLHVFWYEPQFRPDDHRAAVAYLQSQWRPGDVLVVNAGYAYTALATYWQPGTTPGPVRSSSSTDAIAWRGRLTGPLPEPRSDAGLVMLTTGHVEGSAGLGWDDPRSDFFAMPGATARSQIAALFGRFDRVWQYRIYDTVNDPQGVVRDALEQGGTLIDDPGFAGEAFMRVQGFVPRRGAAPPPAGAATATADGLQIVIPQRDWRAASGSVVYPRVVWHAGANLGRVMGTSLRLADSKGTVWSQPPDEQPLGPLFRSDLWPPGWHTQTIAMPVPEGTPPGAYSLYLLAYDTGSGGLLGPWGPLSSPREFAAGQAIAVGTVEVQRPEPEPPDRPALARFGPLALLSATTPATQVSPGDSVPVNLLWQAAEQPGEPLVVVLQLLDGRDQVAASLEAQPVDARFPTQMWEKNELVRDPHTLSLPKDLAPGAYRLIAGVYRASDGQRLQTADGPFGGKSDHFEVKTIDVRP